MIVGIGLDIVLISRIREIKNKDGFVKKVFNDNEIHGDIEKNHQHIAGKFAAKEAVSKALGIGIRSRWKEYEIINDINGKPVCNLYGKTKEYFDSLGAKKIFVSISHEKDIAIAQAIIED